MNDISDQLINDLTNGNREFENMIHHLEHPEEEQKPSFKEEQKSSIKEELKAPTKMSDNSNTTLGCVVKPAVTMKRMNKITPENGATSYNTDECCEVCGLVVTKPLKNYRNMKINERSMNGSMYQQELFKLYLHSVGKSVREVFLETLRLVDQGYIKYTIADIQQWLDKSYQNPERYKNITSETKMCNNCASNVGDLLLYRYCVTYKDSINGKIKQDCKNGPVCPLMHHGDHNARYNHFQ